jgi:hypothetical protein
MLNYNDRLFLSILYYKLEAGLVLSQKHKEFTPRGGDSLIKPYGIYMDDCRVQLKNKNNKLVNEIIRIHRELMRRTLETLSFLSLELDQEAKVIVMSDCTLTKLDRPRELFERNYFAILISLEEETITSIIFSQEKTTSVEVQTLSKQVQRDLVFITQSSIDVLNS